MSALNNGNGNLQPPSPPSCSPRLLPRIAMNNDKPHYYPSYHYPHDFAPPLPRIVQNLHHTKAFALPQASPLPSRSPSVASWCSFDSDYDDGLVIEEIDSDDETLNDSGAEVIEGEYEDPPSDDDEYWDRWRHRQQLSDTQNMIVNGFEELSTSANPSSHQLFTPPMSPAPSTGSKRSLRDLDSDGEETDREDSYTTSGRRTRRRLTPKVPSSLRRTSISTQVMRGFDVPTLRESESQMEE